jgi:hypothetical protein
MVVCGVLEPNWYGPRVWDLDEQRVFTGALPWRQASGFHQLTSCRVRGEERVVVADSGGFLGMITPEFADLDGPLRRWQLPGLPAS